MKVVEKRFFAGYRFFMNTSKNKIVGIDPGQKGAIVIRHNDEVETIVMPMLDGEFDAVAVAELFLEIASEVKMVYLEDIFAMPKSAASSMLSFGQSHGKIVGILTALRIPYTLVRAQKWQKVMLANVTGADTKVRALKAVQKLFPMVELCPSKRSNKPHDGIVDAILISEYGIREEAA